MSSSTAPPAAGTLLQYLLSVLVQPWEEHLQREKTQAKR